MSFALPFRLPASQKMRAVCLVIVLASGVAVVSRVQRKPRPWPADKVPVAFWAWRNQTPAESDVQAAMSATGARTIFLRAGQIDYQDGKLRRIRPVTGSLPRNAELHLVYNATRPLLSQLESVDEELLATSIADAFQEDVARARQEGALVIGLQVDIDAPTRLLGRYGKTLKALRSHLPGDMRLSITGLPTWMQSRALQLALAHVDFWVPQLYGAEIPERLEQRIPISSSASVAIQVSRARELNKPFYAGLAAFSWAVLYNRSGRLVVLRGDMDPAAIASDPNLELTDEGQFEAGEWRLQYKARGGGVTDGLVVHAGDVLVLDLPSSESLRASARKVRELAGDKLLGICVFRLPAPDDPSTLTGTEVAAALQDRETAPHLISTATRSERNEQALLVNFENRGTASARHINLHLTVPAGTVQQIEVPRGATFQTHCMVEGALDVSARQPCSQNRANLIQISSFALRPGDSLKAFVVFRTSPTSAIPVSIETVSDSGRPYLARQHISIGE